MSQLPRYESYKDSGVQWLGEIPSHWKATRIKFLGDIVLGLTYSPEDVTTGESGTLVLRSSNVQNGVLTLGDNVYVEKVIPKKMVTTDQDILICSRNGSRALIGKCALIEGEGVGQAFGAFMTVLRSPYRKYLYYVLSSDLFKFQIGSFLTSTINQLTTYALGNFEIAFPPLEEQKVITDYLDKRLAQVDGLIAKQETLLAKLAEQRVALISHAVTNGLNPDVEMKESGVEWLGKVPKSWGVVRLDKASQIVRGNTGFAKGDLLEEGQYVALQYGKTYKVDEINSTFSAYVNQEFYKPNQVAVYGDTVLISTSETVEDLGHSCFYIRQDIGLIGGEQFLLKPSEKILDKYLYYSSKAFSRYLHKYATGTKVYRFNTDNLKTICITKPSLAEQREIISFIDQEVSRIDTLAVKQNQLIEKLKEYRSILITQVVTGKIDVRNLKAN
ncbi:MAG TPA: restriction endonuclease subunit S [Acinetobacter parvus]|uniref:restriction endonuclease subunit S n=1 Tax=Acinetobacter parvus TaxID=134533 RepID=UPI002CD86686|nr:restriction endonuclease subunit S [Acinetobacter parvus]HRM14889.1 restriction endonuclease subunit S [Acinetobacter parvus]